MSLDAIAALLGHKTLVMTMVYARIADKIVASEYLTDTKKVEARPTTSRAKSRRPTKALKCASSTPRN